MADKPNLFFRIIRYEPGVSLGQWIYDRLVGNWAAIVALFGGLGGMTYLATLTDWARALGPAGIGAIGIASALVVWIGLSFSHFLRAKAKEKQANASAIEEWKKKVDTVNPLDREFHNKRLNVLDLVSPIDYSISEKRFIDCELIGPVTLFPRGKTSINSVSFAAHDIVLLKPGFVVTNAVALIDCEIYGGSMHRVTILIRPDSDIENLRQPWANWITLRPGEAPLPQSPPKPEAKTQP